MEYIKLNGDELYHFGVPGMKYYDLQKKNISENS